MSNLNISVCIPCIEAHVKYLPDCLDSIAKQSRCPDEVVICISNIKKETFNDVEHVAKSLAMCYAGLNIKFSLTTDAKYAGENRNKAVEIATGDVVTFIDADDVMRYDRVYILDQIFCTYPNIIGVIHRFYENILPHSSSATSTFDKKCVKKYQYFDYLHFGHCTFKKILFKDFSYTNKPRGQDVEFFHNILSKHIDHLVIYDQPLTYYISNRSTFYGK